MVSMVTNAPRLQGLLILPNKHSTYKNDQSTPSQEDIMILLYISINSFIK